MRCGLFLIVTLLIATTAAAENWGQFRGPAFNGSSPEKNLPASFSKTKNVVWAADLPGASAATPAVWGDRVFVSSTDVETKTLVALCFDRRNGELLWRRDVGKGISQDSRSNYASPSPATDGERVYFFYGTGDLAAFDLAGKEIWKKNIQSDYGAFAFLWTFSTSPLLYDGKLYLQVLQRDTAVSGRGFTDKKNESYLLALDPQSGKMLWRRVRPSEARSESREAFSTPVPLEAGGRKELLVVGGDDLTGHDPETGRELWRWGTWNPTRIGHWRLVPSAVAGDGVILVCAPKRDPIYAVKAGGKGKLTKNALAWTSAENPELSSDVPSPAFADGDFFVLSDVRKSLARVNPRNGSIKWRLRTPGTAKYEASPLVADGKIYIINFVGTVVVVDANKGEILNEISMDEPANDAVRSGIVAAQGQLFIRANRKLYCVAK
ncbi:MAG: PQQ-binding-like beta-propeller repeat protein [Pirellulaceae bacterium]|jgi:outer membrane protein assembly factor BamB|nr:PQQ-binding-like beta-propeller repeat protein [Pirellulaceae bacterium]MDP7019629.1 PQQ-binding-like beta-propeller repeat protein [Pirellulaceae bacterium]